MSSKNKVKKSIDQFGIKFQAVTIDNSLVEPSPIQKTETNRKL